MGFKGEWVSRGNGFRASRESAWRQILTRYISETVSAIPPIVMRPSSLGGGRILRRTLSVRLSVCLSVRPLPSVTSFRQPLASRMYFSARTEGRISYGHLGRTNSCFSSLEQELSSKHDLSSLSDIPVRVPFIFSNFLGWLRTFLS